MSDGMITFIMIMVAGLATGVGALPMLFGTQVSQRKLDSLLGFAAGVMLAASFSLIMTSIQKGGGGVKAASISSLGIMLGAVFLDLFDKHSPHVHLINDKHEGGDSDLVKGIWLFVIAITIHNFPEGLATGVGFGTGNITDGVIIAMAIAIQNMPEGLAVAVSLKKAGYDSKFSVKVAALTGLIEPVAAGLGLFLVNILEPIVPLILAMAAGTMVFIISDEIIPQTHSGGYEREASYGIMIGFVVMLFLDATLG